MWTPQDLGVGAERREESAVTPLHTHCGRTLVREGGRVWVGAAVFRAWPCGEHLASVPQVLSL